MIEDSEAPALWLCSTKLATIWLAMVMEQATWILLFLLLIERDVSDTE